MPYQIICDGEPVDLGETQYLLSPQDLAAFDLIPRLIEIGVASLKIEGRLKSAEYVANITRHYRQAIDGAWAGRPVEFTPGDVREMELSFSRGFSHGFLDGTDHKILVRGDYPRSEEFILVKSRRSRGAGSGWRPPRRQAGRRGCVRWRRRRHRGRCRTGGRVYEVIALSSDRLELRFGRDAIELGRLRVGQRLWKTDDPELTARLRQTYQGPPSRLVDLDFEVQAELGQPLRIEARTATGYHASVRTRASARARPITRGRRGSLSRAARPPGRHDLSAEEPSGRRGWHTHGAQERAQPASPRACRQAGRRLPRRPKSAAWPPGPCCRRCLGPIAAERDRQRSERRPGHSSPELSVLCRRTAQVEAAVALGIGTVYADYQDIKEYAGALAAARRGGASIYLATPRIEKPGEANLFRYLAKLGADGILVRNAGGLYFCAERGVPFVADFSLNAANPLTVELFKNRGATRVTASYDLNIGQLADLLDAVPPDWLEVVIHQQIPMFHMEHCVYCAFLSPGTDSTNCGRPCDHHDVKLRDRVGTEHPLKADIGCRNTLYNAVPQTAAEFLPGFWLMVPGISESSSWTIRRRVSSGPFAFIASCSRASAMSRPCGASSRSQVSTA